MQRDLMALSLGAREAMAEPDDSPTFEQIMHQVETIQEEDREVFQQLVVDLRLFATSPSFSVVQPSDPPVEGGLMHSLQTLCNIVCKNGTTTNPTTAELNKVSFWT
jgi:hypothetical protein